MLLAGSILLVVAAGFVFSTIRHKGFDWPMFRATLRALDWQWLTLSVLFSYGTYAVRALRWAVLIRPLRPRPQFRKLFSATVIGFSAVTALGRAAEMVRPYLIANKEEVPFSTQVAAWVVERIYDILLALGVFGYALSQVNGSSAALGPALSWVLRVGGAVVGVVSGSCLALLLLMRYRGAHIQGYVLRALSFLGRHHFERVERVISDFLDGVQATRSQSATALLIAWTIAEWALIAACYACVLKAFGGAVPFSPIDVFILMGFVSFGSLIQLPAVGGGAQVTAVLVLTEIFGVPLEVATPLSLILWFISFMSIVPLGVAFALHDGLTWARIKEAEGGAPAERETSV
jgi:uncharacterized protein (TIRG00374 family)